MGKFSEILMGRDLKAWFFYRLPVLGYCLFIFWQSCSASFDSLPSFEYADKIMHLGGYALLGALVVRMLLHEPLSLSRGTLMAVAVVLSIMYGISDEIHQSFVAERCGDVFDVVADGIGSVLGIVVYAHFFDKKKPWILRS